MPCVPGCGSGGETGGAEFGATGEAMGGAEFGATGGTALVPGGPGGAGAKPGCGGTAGGVLSRLRMLTVSVASPSGW
jgi:hypothetical protein